MRHTHELTDETRKVMSGHVKLIALEADISDKHIYGILAGTNTDPFAPFEYYYAAEVRAGAPVCHYDNKLAAIRTRYEKQQPTKPVTACLTDQLNAGAELATGFIEALRDGKIDAHEAERLHPSIDKMRSILDLLETHIQFRRDLKAVS
jgi:hypothetical protein